MYHAELGRFMTRDPLPQEGEPDVLYDNNEFGRWLDLMQNRYGYTRQDPINTSDPSGLISYAVMAEFAEAIETIVGVGLGINGLAPWAVGKPATEAALGPGLPRMLWNHATAGSAVQIVINKYNQGSWDNAVDRITKLKSYNEAVEDMLRNEASKGTHGKAVRYAIRFHDDPRLGASIGHAKIELTYTTRRDGTRHVDVSVWDRYDFHKQHIWKRYQDQGLLTPFEVYIQTETFRYCPGPNTRAPQLSPSP